MCWRRFFLFFILFNKKKKNSFLNAGPVRNSGPRVTSVDVAGPLCTAYSAVAAHRRTPDLSARLSLASFSPARSLSRLRRSGAASRSFSPTCISSVHTATGTRVSQERGSPLTDPSGRTSHRIGSGGSLHLQPLLALRSRSLALPTYNAIPMPRRIDERCAARSCPDSIFLRKTNVNIIF